MKLSHRWYQEILFFKTSVLRSQTLFYFEKAYGGCHPTGEATDPILWAKIEQMDCGDCHSQSSILHKNNLPLLLILGYNTGVQVTITSCSSNNGN